jgi:Pyruvate phosphate dikinase, AMP/ATP-binding domain
MSSRALFLALCLAVTAAPAALGCAAETSDEDGELSEAELSTKLELTTIKSVKTYNSMAVEGGGFGQAGRSMKFLIDAREPTKKVHFVNGNFKVNGKTPDFAKFHFKFAERQLQIPEGNEEFNEVTYFVDKKRYYAGTIQTYELSKGEPPIFAVQLYPDDVAHEAGLVELVKTIKTAFNIPGARMAFVAGGPQQTFKTVGPEFKALGYEALTIEQVLGSVQYMPLNPGEAWGNLRIFPKDQGDVRPTDILVFDELPLDLTVCAATITKVFQDVTSHVNLKSKERGTPNMVMRDASPTNAQLAPFKDKPVHLVVGKSGFTIEATTAAIVAQKFKEHTDKPLIKLPVQKEPNLVWYDDMCKTLTPACTKNGVRFGGKAANLGFLANRDVLGRKAQKGSQSAIAGYDITPQGFAIPMSFYLDFLALPENAAVKAKLDALVKVENQGNLSPNQRKALSVELQQLFYAAKVPPAQLAAINAQVDRLKTLVPDVEKLKLRSSANAEDIPNFDGAGLHDSFSVKLSSTDNADLSCKREESLDGVVTKVDMKPKTVQCAIKGVYASLWNSRAIEERSFARIDHATAAMGLAVVPAYDTESEVAANGVLITRAVNSDFLAYTLGLQKDNNLVTNPEPGSSAQLTLATFGGGDHPTRFTTTRFAKPTAASPPLKTSVMTDAKMNEIVKMTIATEIAYCRVKEGYYPGDCRDVFLDETKPSALDLEFKLLQNGHFMLKQMREFHGD